MNEEILKIENVSKQYRLGMIGGTTLKSELQRKRAKKRGEADPFSPVWVAEPKNKDEFFMALSDISFTINKGERVGIIGHNGAGKSTLLKLISRITAPTSGSIEMNGRVASMLEVGTGFHSEMTGRENIFLNGAILGMTKQEIARKLDEIVEFSGCERYIDTPVKRYSSGMMVRLGFAVAAHLEPEILVVDEVLAVGDAEFQKKAIGKMQDVASGGRTVLFVSHNMNSIKQLCKSGIVLKNGQVDYISTARDSVDYYIGNYQKNTKAMFFDNLQDAPGNDKVRIRSMEVKTSDGKEKITIDDEICVSLQFYNYVANSMIDCTFELRTADDMCVFHRWCNFSPNHDSKIGEQKISFSISKHLLNAGKYYFRVFFGENEAYLMWGDLVYNFEVEYTNEKINGVDDKKTESINKEVENILSQVRQNEKKVMQI